MAKVRDACSEVEVFIDTLVFLIERERQFVPNPSEVVAVEVWSGDIRETLKARRDVQTTEDLAPIRRLMATEPATWHCQTFDEEGGAWRASLSPFLRRYGGLATAAEYVQRVVDMSMPAVASSPMYTSSLSVPEAIDYLNAVWCVKAGGGKPLIRISRAEAAAKLALDCSTVDELESRLSALAGILAQLRLPAETGDRKLIDLREFLGQILSDDAAARARDAVNVLRDIVAIRVWRQHPGADRAGQDAARRLGMTFPTADWGDAWNYLRLRAVTALSAIREEIERSELQTEGTPSTPVESTGRTKRPSDQEG